MNEVVSIFTRAVEKAGLERTRYENQRVPTSAVNVCVLPFFGDLRSTALASSFILKRFREESKGSKYFIMVGWPGLESLFPYVDEYWSVRTELMHNLYANSKGFSNNSNPLIAVTRHLNYFFEDVIYAEEFDKFYNNGFLQMYLDKYKNFKRYFPTVASSAYLGSDLMRELGRRSGEKIVIFPFRCIETWDRNNTFLQKTTPDFWEYVVSYLSEKGYVPIVVKCPITHDLGGAKHVVFESFDVRAWMALMRVADCTIDFFGGVSRLAMLARSPFIALDQRSRYNQSKEYEFEDLAGWHSLPGDHIYSFPTIIINGNPSMWKDNMLDLLFEKLGVLFKSLDKNNLPSTGESYSVIPYAVVRERKVKKFGTRFLKVPIV